MRMIASLVAIVMWSAVAQETQFQVGLAEIDITPPVGYRMDGYFYRAPEHRAEGSAQGQGAGVSAGRDAGGARRLRSAWHAAVHVERGSRPGGEAARAFRQRTSPSPPRTRTPGRSLPANGRGSSANRRRRSSGPIRSRR